MLMLLLILTNILRSRRKVWKKRRCFGVSDYCEKLNERLSIYSIIESLKGSHHEGPIQIFNWFHFDVIALYYVSQLATSLPLLCFTPNG